MAKERDGTTVTVSVMGKQFQVKCEPNEVDALKRSADFLDTRMQDMKREAGVVGFERLTIMAALNLANELLEQTRKADLLDAHHDDVAKLSGKVDSAIDRLKD